MSEILTFHDTNVSSKPSRREMWSQFCDDRSLRQTHQITDHEMAMLERTALLGEFNSSEDLLFMLKVIRGAASTEPQGTPNDARIQRAG
jgi:hypothetical protein